MELWLDANISPAIASFIRSEFSISCFHLRDFTLRDASDHVIFSAAKSRGNVVLITKDDDFCRIITQSGPPPKIIWLSFGNCSNQLLKEILNRDLRKALDLLANNDLVEIMG